jgi:hypothetical protein
MREAMQQLFRDAVEQADVPFVLIAGDRNRRLRIATEAIDALLLANAPDPARKHDANSQE